MKILITILLGITVLFYSVSAQETEEDTVNPLGIIIHLDREISALFDAYLQAVPQCPISKGNEANNWIIDIALLRAKFAYTLALNFPQSPDSTLTNAWIDYLDASLQYIEVFSVIQKTYHSSVDSIVSVALENELILCDSLWSVRETDLFQILAEKGITYEQSE
ncbi:MAG: hypothetical protein H8D05_01385 [FCB group bacterium]|nr:hypothetical protein [FCB group bacterium]